MDSWTPVGARARRGLRAVTALALPVTTLALIGFSTTAAHAANPTPTCTLAGDHFDCTVSYAFTGAEQTFQVPDDVTSIDVVATGASGGYYSSSIPGHGARVSGTLDVTPGTTYFVEVGGQGLYNVGGFNGGGNPANDSYGGGGATDLRTVSRAGGGSLLSRLVVAGGGGGTDVGGSNGGDGGLVGGAGVAGSGATGGGGQGGTQTAGGAAGTNGNQPGTPGSLGVGGNGGVSYGGGGGGGLYGGGGGGGSTTTVGTGGGGGSSLVPSGGTVTVSPTVAAGSLTATYASPITDADLALGAPSVAAGVADPVTMTVTDGVTSATVTPDSLTVAPTGGATGAACTASACSATQVGTYTVTGTYGTFVQKATFQVVAGEAGSITLTPASGTAAAGDQVAYTVTGTDTHGNDLGDITGDSLVTSTGPGGSGVSCPSGVCTFTTPGAYTIDASTPGAGAEPVTDSASLTVVAGNLATIKLSPATAVISSGQSRHYAVTGADAFGNPLGDLTSTATVTFAPYDGGAATTCDEATCAPSAPGTYQVTADVDGTTATATLVVQAVATEVTVSPVSGIVFGDDVPVSAGVSTEGGAPTGTVQFSLDGSDLGAPVALDPDGQASLPDLTGLHAGLHTIGAAYSSEDGSFLRGEDQTAFVVEKAPTTTAVTAAPGTLTATVTGAGDPSGEVTFFVDGVDVGTATLADRTAVLTGTAHNGGSVIGAAYSGDGDHAASSASTSRTAPVVTTKVSGAGAHGWYSGPVTVSFVCGPDVPACPAPVVLAKEGVGQYVTKTVVGADGGVATVTAGPVNIDLTAPVVSISRVGDGKTYKGRARIAACAGGDTLSGLASCTVSTTGGPFGTMTSTVTATDLAGNTATRTATYEVLGTWVARSKRDGSAWTVARGSRRVLHVMSTSKPALAHSSKVGTRGFRMVGRTGGTTHWVAAVTPRKALKAGSTVSLKVKSSQGRQTVRLRITK